MNLVFLERTITLFFSLVLLELLPMRHIRLIPFESLNLFEVLHEQVANASVLHLKHVQVLRTNNAVVVVVKEIKGKAQLDRSLCLDEVLAYFVDEHPIRRFFFG